MLKDEAQSAMVARLKVKRKAEKLTRAELARIVGVSLETIGRAERGGGFFNWENARRIRGWLGDDAPPEYQARIDRLEAELLSERLKVKRACDLMWRALWNLKRGNARLHAEIRAFVAESSDKLKGAERDA